MVTLKLSLSLVWGIAGSFFILTAFYFIQVLGMQDWKAPIDFILDKWYFVGPLVAGFGIQAGLFRAIHGLAHHGGGGTIATSGSVSGTTMLACCMHNLVLLFPILGANGIATFFAVYQTQVFLLSIGVSILGIVYMIGKYYSIKRACETRHN